MFWGLENPCCTKLSVAGFLSTAYEVRYPKNDNSALGDTILKMHAILIPMFNKLLLLQKQVTKYTLDIFESPFVTQQSNVRNILNILKSNSIIPLPYVLC